MPRKVLSLPAQYAFAVAVVAMATLVRWMLEPVLSGRSFYAFFVLATTVVAWYCRRGPALFSIALGLISSYLFFIRPLEVSVTGWVLWVETALYLLVGTVAAFLVQSTRAAMTGRRRAQQALRRSEYLYRAIAESIDYGIWICNAEGRNIYVSESMLKVLGLTQEQSSREEWPLAIHPDDRERTVREWRECVRTGCNWDHEVRFLGVDGKYHPVLVRGVPVRDQNGAILGWAGINLDISRLKEAEEALRDADRRKDQFLATLAHELRNPLAPIRNALSYLQLKGLSDPGERRALDIIDRQLRHTVRLVDDLLDVSRVTLGRVQLRKQMVELHDAIDTAIEGSRPLIEAAGHHFSMDLSPQSLYVQGDPTRLSQILQNLLNNAVKYTPSPGRIDLSLRQADGQARISIRDDGVGIRPDMLPKLFEMFSQIERSSSLQQGGLGIGLALAQKLAHLHGGRIEAFSEGEGRGTEFVLVLPLAEEPRLPAVDGEPAGPEQHGRNGPEQHQRLQFDGPAAL